MGGLMEDICYFNKMGDCFSKRDGQETNPFREAARARHEDKMRTTTPRKERQPTSEIPNYTILGKHDIKY